MYAPIDLFHVNGNIVLTLYYFLYTFILFYSLLFSFYSLFKNTFCTFQIFYESSISKLEELRRIGLKKNKFFDRIFPIVPIVPMRNKYL